MRARVPRLRGGNGDRPGGGRRGGRGPRGFTLLELLIAVGLVSVLLGLAVAATGTIVRRFEVRRTDTVLAQLDAALDAWRSAGGRRLRRAADPGADLEPGTPHVFVLTEILTTIERHEDVRAILGRLPPRLTHRYAAFEVDDPPIWVRTFYEELALADHVGGLTVLDAWGTPIYATHPGETAAPGAPPPVDGDGTERTENEIDFGSARGRRICFVSAGPDGRFGTREEFPGVSGAALVAARAAARRDNRSSYAPQFDGP